LVALAAHALLRMFPFQQINALGPESLCFLNY
jgi:hypothetical protein